MRRDFACALLACWLLCCIPAMWIPWYLEDAAVLTCPACGYSPEDEVSVETDAPATREEEVDFFEVAGAHEGCVFCPACACEFLTETGVPMEG